MLRQDDSTPMCHIILKPAPWLQPSQAVCDAPSMALLNPMLCFSTITSCLQDAAAKGWIVLGAAGESGARDVRSVKVDAPTILVVGEYSY
jgi:hypothetical protein